MRTQEQIEALLDRLEVMLNDVDAANGRYEDQLDKDAWEGEFGEQIHKYDDDMKFINNDDSYDFITDARKTYNDKYAKSLSKADYVKQLLENAENLIGRIKEKYGNNAAAETETAEEEAPAEEVAETPIEETPEEDKPAEEAPEANAEAEAETKIEADVDTDEDGKADTEVEIKSEESEDEDELAEETKQIEEELKKYHRGF